MEDYPSESDYYLETGKHLLTNPKYFYGKGLKGIAEGTEFLVGQPLQTLFSQTGKNFEFYQPVAGEKLGINKFIEENKPEFPTTGTLLAGDVAEVAGSVLDPFLAYGIVKGATSALKTKAPVVIEETIDPTRRDLLKMGAVITGGAIAYPTAKKLGLLDNTLGELFEISIPISAIAATAIGLIESFGAEPADKTSTRPCPRWDINPAAICERPAL
jgi:hypothetical protein